MVLTSSLKYNRHGNKNLDLSLPFRFTKLSPGAKLELVQLPKGRSSAPASVTVALQIMDSSASRLTEKFLATTSIWAILRSFEQKSQNLGVSGINITEQPVVSTNEVGGSGRLFYAMPVVQIVNRELATLEDLQKTLQDLGFNGGTALLRLKMRPTDIPLEEALEKISAFAPVVTPLPATPGEAPPVAPPPPLPQASSETVPLKSTETKEPVDAVLSPPEDAMPISETSEAGPPTETGLPEPPQYPHSREITVLAPAQGNVPEAAKRTLQFFPILGLN